MGYIASATPRDAHFRKELRALFKQNNGNLRPFGASDGGKETRRATADNDHR
jgi:hypothetical protein